MTVPFSLRRFRQIAWVAMFALMLNVLAPGISHALVSAGALPADSIEICTPKGIERLTALDAAADPDNGGASLSPVAACAYCMAHAASFGLPPSADHALLPQPAAPPAFIFSATPTPARAWVVQSPRAPPVYS